MLFQLVSVLWYRCTIKAESVSVSGREANVSAATSLCAGVNGSPGRGQRHNWPVFFVTGWLLSCPSPGVQYHFSPPTQYYRLTAWLTVLVGDMQIDRQLSLRTEKQPVRWDMHMTYRTFTFKHGIKELQWLIPSEQSELSMLPCKFHWTHTNLHIPIFTCKCAVALNSTRIQAFWGLFT